MAADGDVRDYPRYLIDVEWHQHKNRSFLAFAKSRIALLGGDSLEEEAQKDDPRKLFSAIKSLDRAGQGFITPDLPLMEAVFRVLLAEGNEPLTPIEIKDRLMEWWEQVPNRDVEPRILKKMLDSDRFYGFRRLSSE